MLELNKKRKLQTAKDLHIQKCKIKIKKIHQSIYEIAYHEAGHAVVAELLKPNSVEKIRHKWTAGGTTHYKRQYFFLEKEEDIEKDIMIALAGRAAVDVVYGKFEREGIESDCEKVRTNVQRILYKLKKEESLSSESELRKKRLLVEAYYEKTKKLIAENRRFLDVVAKALVEDRVLNERKLQTIKKQFINER